LTRHRVKASHGHVTGTAGISGFLLKLVCPGTLHQPTRCIDFF
jgi:hypothetical protein